MAGWRAHVGREQGMDAIGQRLQRLPLLFGLGQRPEEHAGQDRDDGENDQQLDEREARLSGWVSAAAIRARLHGRILPRTRAGPLTVGC